MNRRPYVLRNRIRELRVKKGYSQTKLAELSYTTQNTISSLETGQYMPTAYLSGLICKALDVTWEECFYYEKTQKYMDKKKKNIYICTSVSIPPQKRPRISYSIEKREDFWHLMEAPRKVIDCNGGVKKND